MMAAITIAQLAPDTAVRWLSELVFIAASRGAVTAAVSPIASPGNRSPPSPGRAEAAAVNRARRSPKKASQPGGSTITCGGPRPKRSADAASPGSVRRRFPARRTVAPIRSSPVSGRTANTTTGTVSAPLESAFRAVADGTADVSAPTPLRVARNRTRSVKAAPAEPSDVAGSGADTTVKSATTASRCSAAARTTSGSRCGALTPTTDAITAAAAQHTAARGSSENARAVRLSLRCRPAREGRL